MHAIRLHAFGPAENLRYESIADPVPGPGQVRIAVAASGVHVIDTTLRSGVPAGPLPLPELPTIPGREVAGTVDRIGPDVDETWLGRSVVAHIGAAPGGYAELTLTEVERLQEIPPNLSPAEAVAMIGTGRTALGILQFADMDTDTVAIVMAAAGGIGTLLVQYLRNAGATVIGLAGGPDKVDLVSRNGAHLAVDYLRPDWPDRVRAEYGDRPATLLLGGVGGDTGRAALDLLAKGGQRLVYGFQGGPAEYSEAEMADRGITSRSVLGPQMFERAGGQRTLETRALTEAAAGRLRPAIRNFPLSEAAAAHHALETRATTGKVVLIPGEARTLSGGSCVA
ncbi:zinc-binding dehydrogenase [Nocardia huaxiensis]|uniref:zinc-binding dehydrogenase n=1 Tax=Nocardia huaxiensis TaxID=2755382 RepID=UPI001E4FDFDA|nr:zinc-binding dehydrogenase [Nocardia huaxiensis]UFS98825.1 zinc-binding dehydrogenase [Nocardia huaxiensis]